MHRLQPFAFALLMATLAGAARAQWTQPTDEELKMTSQAGAPGVDAVYLFRDEITNDKLHYWSKYVRLKVLTERGKEYANVQLRQYNDTGHGGYTVGDIQGRTVHPDGKVIPFTGKPYEKLLEKNQGYTEKSKVFTLPDVEVGSIVEYRYSLRYDDDVVYAPSWYVQSELYTRKAHYLWRPTDRPLTTSDDHGGQVVNTIAWMPIIPKGFEVKQIQSPVATGDTGLLTLELNIHDITPTPEEEYMPAMGGLSYRVLFYYSPYRTADEFWKNEGKRWARTNDRFIGPGPGVQKAVRELVADSDSFEQKLRKLYAAVMLLDNTSYNRTRTAAEEKSEGLAAPKSTDDILERKRGTDDQIARLFIAMARAAGFKAWPMEVVARDRSIFIPGYLNLGQFDDTLAIVQVDGKDQFFDPGQRDCPYGHLAWKHTFAQGLRQTENGTAFGAAPDEPYTSSRIQRVAVLTLDEHGVVTGTVKMTWTGAPALNWRQRALRGDETSIKRDLRTTVERLLPSGMDVKLVSIDNLEAYEKPLSVNYTVEGPIASSTGKRLLLPGDIFVANAPPVFPHEKREVPVSFDYSHIVQDAVRVTFPAGFTIESAPVAEKIPMQKYAAYSLSSESGANSVTVRRDLILGTSFFPVADYPELRTFYNKLQTRDQEPTVLKAAAATPPAGN